jgi:hypothetical protein
MLRPHLEGRTKLHWEFHVDETSEELWMINGIVPPRAASEAEKAWAKGNAAALLIAPLAAANSRVTAGR